MENPTPVSSIGGEPAPLKLNVKRTMLIGFAFFGILLMWQVYDTYCSSFLSELFMKAMGKTEAEDVQYLVGIIMAIDNIAALIMMPIFGRLSDKTNTPLGKRMPYILVGTFVCAVAFPFIPLAFHFNNLAALIVLMAITVFFAMMYRNPAVALMPDLTPKPLRSKANGIINIMGYLGGAVPSFLGMALVLSKYLGQGDPSWQTGNIWVIEIPFLLASVLMIASVLVLFFTIKENKLARELAPELERGEAMAEVADSVANDDDDGAKMSKANRTMLWLILIAEFFWYMADNGISTFLVNYTRYYLQASTGSVSLTTIFSGVASVIGFALAGFIVTKIGRKWTLSMGLLITLGAYAAWMIFGYAFPPAPVSGTELNPFPIFLYIIFVLKGFGMGLVHVNSFPMVVELCSGKRVGRFTGYYYASSMASQTVTPILLGSLMLMPQFSFRELPVYAVGCVLVSVVCFLFVKNIRSKKENIKTGLEAIGADD